MKKLSNVFRKNWKSLVWLPLFIAACYWKYGLQAAPRAILAISFFYILAVYTLMVIPFTAGCAGLKNTKSYFVYALIMPLVIAATYQIIYNESILRMFYQGQFDKQYILGLMLALVILPAASFFIGLLLRKY